MTSRWAASAAVVAAMTATAAPAEAVTGEIDVSAIAFADPPDELPGEDT